MKNKLFVHMISLFPLTIILGTGLIMLVIKFAETIDSNPLVILALFGVGLVVFASVWFFRFITEK